MRLLCNAKTGTALSGKELVKSFQLDPNIVLGRCRFLILICLRQMREVETDY